MTPTVSEVITLLMVLVYGQRLRPGQAKPVQPSTMPHLIVRSGLVDPAAPEIRTWVGSGQWIPREVGDEDATSYLCTVQVLWQTY